MNKTASNIAKRVTDPIIKMGTVTITPPITKPQSTPRQRAFARGFKQREIE